MGLLTLLSKIGSSIVAMVLPSVGKGIVNKVNEFIDSDEDKLSEENATGEQVAEKFKGLPEETQKLILESEVAREAMALQALTHKDDNTVKLQMALIDAENKGSKTRPIVVYIMTVLVFVGLGVAIGTNAYIAYMAMKALAGGENAIVAAAEITALKELVPDYSSWGVILAFPCWVIRSYFGDRSEDKRVRASASIGQNIEPKKTLGGTIGDVVTKKLFKK